MYMVNQSLLMAVCGKLDPHYFLLFIRSKPKAMKVLLGIRRKYDCGDVIFASFYYVLKILQHSREKDYKHAG